ncbi:methyltransferase domain-containing protein [Sphingobacterium hungaricum]
MAWNPDVYNQFKNERYQPFYDLISHIEKRQHMHVLDLGCGTGELTNHLAEQLDGATVVGVDNSAEMLSKAPKKDTIVFEEKSIETVLDEDRKWDVIVANASLQWIDDHEALIPKIISRLKPNGQVAIQMPLQSENLLNQLLFNLANQEPYRSSLQGYNRVSPVLSMDAYAKILFEHQAVAMTIYQKMYPIIAKQQDELFNFISGSALIPYLEKLNVETALKFTADFKKSIDQEFPEMPAIYAFKRIILHAKFN